ncbi:MAG: endonuclease/exonuclease/phosphatase family protein [Clostridiales bacterium]|nr:endonuclease/exonuclease/phosphatase family protein [Clostridiales bacterium]
MNVIFGKILAGLISAVMAISSAFGITYADSCKDIDFPRIGITEKDKDAVRVMSFNIRYGEFAGVEMRKRISLVVAEILSADPDSFGVQEATPGWMAALKLLLPGYASEGREREGNGKGECTAVFYKRSKYKLIDSNTFWLSETPGAPSVGWDADCKRVCTWVRLKNRVSGETYVHINSHFDHIGDKACEESAKMVTKLIENCFPDERVVFTADLNSTRSSSAYRIMTETLSDTALTAEDSMTYGTFHNGDPIYRANYVIDFVLCSDKFTPVVYRTVTEGIAGRFVSDHFPIYADLIMNDEGDN